MAVTAYIALGANLGERERTIAAALEKLEHTPGVNVTKVSTLMETPSVGGPPDSPPYVNAAAEIVTSLPAPALLARLLEIEHELGRVRREKWGPRVIDLDLLLYGDATITAEGLQIPHPMMHQRRFVLAPLEQIAPDANHPTSNKSVRALLAEVDAH
jgi:2-amino-4-hydroxy-6-hydroxymethyldihydropteridine diphosphokinase